MADPKTLAYFDNANHVPAPYGVAVPFNEEQKDIWLGYDEMTGELCITNFNRTAIITCFSGSANRAYGYGYFNQALDYIAYVAGSGDILGGASLPLLLTNNLNISQVDGTTLKFAVAGRYQIDYFFRTPETLYYSEGSAPAPIKIGLSLGDNLEPTPPTIRMKTPIILGESVEYPDVIGSFIVDIPAGANVRLIAMPAVWDGPVYFNQSYKIAANGPRDGATISLTANKIS
jgi:hypothetical protein